MMIMIIILDGWLQREKCLHRGSCQAAVPIVCSKDKHVVKFEEKWRGEARGGTLRLAMDCRTRGVSC